MDKSIFKSPSVWIDGGVSLSHLAKVSRKLNISPNRKMPKVKEEKEKHPMPNTSNTVLAHANNQSGAVVRNTGTNLYSV